MELERASFAAALVLGGAYLVGGLLSASEASEHFWARRRYISAAAGISVAYIFVDVLPELGALGATLHAHGGGIGTLFGPVFGAALITLLPEYIRGLQEFRMIFFGLLVTAIVLVRPRGLIDEELVRWVGRLFQRRTALPK